jgi:hypothetical protein
MKDGFEEAADFAGRGTLGPAAMGLGVAELRFQCVAHRHLLVDFGDDAVFCSASGDRAMSRMAEACRVMFQSVFAELFFPLFGHEPDYFRSSPCSSLPVNPSTSRFSSLRGENVSHPSPLSPLRGQGRQEITAASGTSWLATRLRFLSCNRGRHRCTTYAKARLDDLVGVRRARRQMRRAKEGVRGGIRFG